MLFSPIITPPYCKVGTRWVRQLTFQFHFPLFYSFLSFSHCKAYLWQQILAWGSTRSTQIPAHHDGDVASTRLARVMETVLLSTDLDFLGFWISTFLKFKLNHVPFCCKLDSLGIWIKRPTLALVIWSFLGRSKAGQRMEGFVVVQIFRFVDHDVTVAQTI